MTKLSLLDLTPATSRSAVSAALRGTVDLARHAEHWGYHRYWVAEHHGIPGIASASPPVLTGHLADATTRIRIGAGGVMLPNHSPLVVAEQFSLLAALHPGRIDLGLGRGPVLEPAIAAALRRPPVPADDFPDRLTEVTELLSGGSTPGKNSLLVPGGEHVPSIWLLGSSVASARLAGELGLQFCYSHHLTGQETRTAIQAYRDGFRAAGGTRPYAAISVAVYCADTEREARRMFQPQQLCFLPPSLNPGPGLTEVVVATRHRDAILGDPATVTAQLTDLITWSGADEILILTHCHDHKARLRSYQLIAETIASPGP